MIFSMGYTAQSCLGDGVGRMVGERKEDTGL